MPYKAALTMRCQTAKTVSRSKNQIKQKEYSRYIPFPSCSDCSPANTNKFEMAKIK